MQEIKIRMDDTYMPVIIFGSGKKNFVMLSGLSLCGLEGLGGALAERFKMLQDEFTVYVFDRRKFLHPGATSVDMAEDIVKTLKILNVDKATFYGVSHGGLMAVYIAEKYPEMVENLILGASATKSTGTLKKTMGDLNKLAVKKDIVELNRYFMKNVYTPGYLDKLKNQMDVLEKKGSDADCERMAILTAACGNTDFDKDLEKIKCKVFAFVGDDDHIMGTDGYDQIKNRCKNVIIKRFPNYGHAIYDEMPEVIQMVRDFAANEE